MARDPITDNRCKFSQLHIETAIIPRRKAKRIFVKTNLSSVIAGIEPAIESRLSEEINLRPQLRVEKESQSRIEEVVNVAVDEPGRWLLEMIRFEIDCAAQSRAKIVLKRSDSEGAVEPVQKIIDLKRACCADEQTKAERPQQSHGVRAAPSHVGAAIRK